MAPGSYREPTIRDFRLTNEAVLGAFMDDNSAPLSFIQTSVGLFDGGRLADKDFPVPNDVEGSPALFGTELKAIPDEPGGPGAERHRPRTDRHAPVRLRKAPLIHQP
ncbi:hypothetical protein [Streptomyces sp. NPDC060205]|uniref:hypothetical protein n=1 Tax=Streptomyces sp. NPDC060205 TaxID=3347072 RepID=UPI0036697140